MSSASPNALYKWCPLLWWAVTFFSTLIVGDFAYRTGQHQPGHSMYVIIGAAAAAAIVLEAIIARGWTCSFVPESLYARWVIYFLSTVIGLLLVSTMSSRVPTYYAIAAFALLVIPVLSLLIVHSEREHMDKADTFRHGVLMLFSEWPGYLLIAISVLIVVVLIFGKRVTSS